MFLETKGTVLGQESPLFLQTIASKPLRHSQVSYELIMVPAISIRSSILECHSSLAIEECCEFCCPPPRSQQCVQWIGERVPAASTQSGPSGCSSPSCTKSGPCSSTYLDTTNIIIYRVHVRCVVSQFTGSCSRDSAHGAMSGRHGPSPGAMKEHST